MPSTMDEWVDEPGTMKLEGYYGSDPVIDQLEAKKLIRG